MLFNIHAREIKKKEKVISHSLVFSRNFECAEVDFSIVRWQVFWLVRFCAFPLLLYSEQWQV